MDNKKFFVQNGLVTGAINLDADTGNIDTPGEITTGNLTVNGRLKANIELDKLDITKLIIRDQFILQSGETKATFHIQPNILEVSTINSPFVISNEGQNTQFSVLSNGSELFQINDNEVRARTKVVTPILATTKIVLGNSAALQLAPKLLELSTNNTAFIISNNGDNARFCVINNTAELLKVDGSEIKINVKLEATAGINASSLVASEIAGTITTSSQPNINEIGPLALLNTEVLNAPLVNSKEINSDRLFGLLGSPNQPDVHSVGTLNQLLVEGQIRSNTSIVLNDVTLTSEGNNLIASGSVQTNLALVNQIVSPYRVIAEYLESDNNYEIGTVLEFGGDRDVTISKLEGSNKVAGIVVDDKEVALQLNNKSSEFALAVGITGVVPCRITGQVRKGCMLVSAGNGTAKVDLDPKVGTVIAKALADHYGTTGTILVKLMTA